jgi:hypothetical protein
MVQWPTRRNFSGSLSEKKRLRRGISDRAAIDLVEIGLR